MYIYIYAFQKNQEDRCLDIGFSSVSPHVQKQKPETNSEATQHLGQEIFYLVANYPRIVSGLVHPSYKWINPTKIPCKSLGL